jgi:polyisoprenoid-binding protein YceI
MTDTLIRTTTWTIDPAHSSVEFSVKVVMFATARGRFPEVSGTITLDNEQIENSRVAVAIGAASIETHDDKRDGHLKSPTSSMSRTIRPSPFGAPGLRPTVIAC